MKQNHGLVDPSHSGMLREIPELTRKLNVWHRVPDGRAGWEVLVARISCRDVHEVNDDVTSSHHSSSVELVS